MFGNLGAYVNGNMFAGTFGHAIGVKLLDQSSHDMLAAVDGVGPFGPSERPMKGYLSLPDAWIDDSAESARWLEEALHQVSALPPKATGQRRRNKSPD
jgi:TfoX/Sxy family transcriptional regulator of competence genes